MMIILLLFVACTSAAAAAANTTTTATKVTTTLIRANITGPASGPSTMATTSLATATTTTPKSNCSASQLREVEKEKEACWAAADSGILQSAIDNDNDMLSVAAAICKAWADKLDCYRNVKSKCHDNATIEDYLNNYMYNKLANVHKGSYDIDILLVVTCDLLSEYEPRVVKWKTGGNLCSYENASEAIRKHKECLSRTDQQALAQQSIEHYVDNQQVNNQFYFRRRCFYQREMVRCLSEHSCLTPKKRSEKELENRVTFDAWERQMQREYNFPDFSYEQTCPRFYRNVTALQV